MKEVKYIFEKNKEAVIQPDGIAVISRECKIIVFNEAASRISGYDEDEILNNDCDILFRNRLEDLRYVKESINDKKTFTNLTLRITDKQGNVRQVLASVTPILKVESVLSVVLVFRDAFEMISLAEELEEKTYELLDQKNRLDAIFNSNIEGTFTIDNNWNITSFNRSAETITGYQKTEAIGRKCWDIFNSKRCRNGCHMELTMSEGKSAIGIELDIINKTDKMVPIKVNSAILRNNKQEIIGAVETFLDLSELKNLSSHLDEKYRFQNIIGKSKELQQANQVLESVSATNSTVLITGESGTGKELAARAIHINSSRHKAPFIAVNCSAFAETLIESELFGHEAGAFTGATKTKIGRFELAQGGTLFLDEIGDLSLGIQTKLLRVLENLEFERVGGNKTIKIDTRIIAATNKDLIKEIEISKFREDLFYRINVINIHLPPLRERKDDLPLLINHFIEHFNKKFSKSIQQFSASAFELLLEYRYPGNIRELENIVEHSFILCNGSIVEVEHLPKRIRESIDNKKEVQIEHNRNYLISKSTDYVDKIAMAEKEVILTVLKKNNGNKRATAKELNIDSSTLWRKMKKLNI